MIICYAFLNYQIARTSLLHEKVPIWYRMPVEIEINGNNDNLQQISDETPAAVVVGNSFEQRQATR